MDRNDQLRNALNSPTVRPATTPGQAIELQRALGKAIAPPEAGPDEDHSPLRNARPHGIPTLCRLVCNAFDPFLTDSENEPRIEGLIPRRAIKPWWAGVLHVAGNEIAALEQRLKPLLAAASAGALDELEQEAQREAVRWSASIVTELERARPDPVLAAFLPSAFAQDARVIARILPMSQAITASIKALTRLLGRLDALEGACIRELPPDAVTLLKQHYLALSEDHGTNARYLALAVTNRLSQPSQILRLGRALSWKPTDSLVAGTEFAFVGGRVVDDLQRLSRAIARVIQNRESLPGAAELHQRIRRYMDDGEALIGEIGMRRGAPWGEAILRTRNELADRFRGDLLPALARRILAAMPPAQGDTASTRENPAATAEAVDSAQLLQLLARRGQRHGFAQAARTTLNALAGDAEARTDAVIRRVYRDPASAEALRPEIEAAAKVFEILFEEGRGALLLRQLANAARASA